MPSNRWQHWLVRIAAGTTIALIAGVVAGWLAFQHIPSWYAPPVVGEADLARVRASLPESYQTFTDRLAEGGTFEFELSARRINEWIAARGALWPDARDVLPVWLREPVVGFLPDRIVVAARYERGG